MKTKSLTIKQNYSLSSPEQMASMANVLKDHIIKHNLYTPIVGKNYVNVEGWQFAGGLLGAFPRIKSVQNLSTGTEIKWQAEVEIVDKTGKVVSTGFAVCSNKESKKKTFDEYAILSMAQTRAIGKAYRNIIGWVIKLAGYEATPKEEAVNIGSETPKVVIPTESGIQEELTQIQELLIEQGFKTPTKQLQAIKAYCKRENVEFDGFKMTKSTARNLLAALLKKKLEIRLGFRFR